MNHLTYRDALPNAKDITRSQQIMEILSDSEMTARDIAYRLGYYDLNAVRPRITELLYDGHIVACNKVIDPITRRTVALYRRTYHAE